MMKYKKYVYRAYHSSYPRLFAQEKARLIKLLPGNSKIEHVGSTAIQGLGGKGIIDIALRIPLRKLNLSLKRLEGAGYEYNPEHQRDERRVFLQRKIISHKKERRVHLHIVLGGNFWNSFISFRDYLRKHPGVKNEYARIKKEASRHAQGDAIVYRTHKAAFLAEIAEKALKELQ